MLAFMVTTCFSKGLKTMDQALNFITEGVQLEHLNIKWWRIANIYFIDKRKLTKDLGPSGKRSKRRNLKGSLKGLIKCGEISAYSMQMSM